MLAKRARAVSTYADVAVVCLKRAKAAFFIPVVWKEGQDGEGFALLMYGII